MGSGRTRIARMELSPMFCEYPLPLPESGSKLLLDQCLRLYIRHESLLKKRHVNALSVMPLNELKVKAQWKRCDQSHIQGNQKWTFHWRTLSISAPSWVILDGGAYVGVWKLCLVLQGRAEWDCRSYKEQPDFARASQTFLIIALLCHFACLLIMAIYTSITITCFNKTLTVICLCLITFSAGCMTLMGTIVMGVKAQDYLESLKLQNMRVINNLPSLIDVEITGPIGVGCKVLSSFPYHLSFLCTYFSPLFFFISQFFTFIFSFSVVFSFILPFFSLLVPFLNDILFYSHSSKRSSSVSSSYSLCRYYLFLYFFTFCLFSLCHILCLSFTAISSPPSYMQVYRLTNVCTIDFCTEQPHAEKLASCHYMIFYDILWYYVLYYVSHSPTDLVTGALEI
ncbi:unnamed protein product [Acanthosepion pharaonis]|uniref:Uncharacterized protein n=1 Tax=Acanthosepion pharaonis TaxID=158019 RepID=A0A812ESQ6_ACAPH|nr:unnamed protein product [Sepia pharaonis]